MFHVDASANLTSCLICTGVLWQDHKPDQHVHIDACAYLTSYLIVSGKLWLDHKCDHCTHFDAGAPLPSHVTVMGSCGQTIKQTTVFILMLMPI